MNRFHLRLIALTALTLGTLAACAGDDEDLGRRASTATGRFAEALSDATSMECECLTALYPNHAACVAQSGWDSDYLRSCGETAEAYNGADLTQWVSCLADATDAFIGCLATATCGSREEEECDARFDLELQLCPRGRGAEDFLYCLDLAHR